MQNLQNSLDYLKREFFSTESFSTHYLFGCKLEQNFIIELSNN